MIKTLEHVDYPHMPGRLYDCAACELGDCECNPETDAPCVSIHCAQGDQDFALGDVPELEY